MPEIPGRNISGRTIALLGTTAFVGLVALSVVGGSFYTVDQGDRAVITYLGEIVGVSEPGFHTKLPFIETANEISLRTNLLRLDALATYSNDQQPAEITLTVAWKPVPGREAEVYERFGSLRALQDRVLIPSATEAFKVVFGQFNAATAISERAKLNQKVVDGVTAAVVGSPIIIESVRVENIDFSDAYESSIEKRMLAEVEVAQLRQNAAREIEQAKITVTKATAAADSAIADATGASRSSELRAQGEAKATVLRATAEAQAIAVKATAEAGAIRQRGDALPDNPQLVDLTKAEAWDGKLPTTMIPGTAIPFLDVAAK
jgi:regulator of protease activity HflC (stomatin/prohibitin superfamily)